VAERRWPPSSLARTVYTPTVLGAWKLSVAEPVMTADPTCIAVGAAHVALVDTPAPITSSWIVTPIVHPAATASTVAPGSTTPISSDSENPPGGYATRSALAACGAVAPASSTAAAAATQCRIGRRTFTVITVIAFSLCDYMSTKSEGADT
jgi:hypothetical protein